MNVVRVRVTADRRREAEAAIHATTLAALEDVAEGCLGEANLTVPIEETTLERSGTVDVDAEGMATAVQYDTPYAVVQHEDPTLRHDPGRRDHWLEATVDENRERYLAYIAAKTREATA